MGDYTTALIVFGLMFSVFYIKETNVFGKVITAIMAAFYVVFYVTTNHTSVGIEPAYIYVTGLVLVIVYAVVQKDLQLIQKIVMSVFSILILVYISAVLNGIDISDYKVFVFFPLAAFAYIFYNKEDYEGELSFLNLMFIEVLMTISILLNN